MSSEENNNYTETERHIKVFLQSVIGIFTEFALDGTGHI